MYAPAQLVVSEDGSQTDTFSVSLGTEPLSAVTLSFRSAFGELAFSPASVEFTYLNYAANVTILVSAVDDDLDQGAAHGDSVVTTLSTEDSLFDCLEADRLCGLAAHYKNWTYFPRINATIVNDDTAGVILSKSTLSTTYDNFGDALAEGLFTVRLASKPYDDVMVTLSGLGAFSTASPSTFIVSPSLWDRPVPVRVASSAPTSARPVCPITNRFCSEMASRVELVHHSSASTGDPLYDGLVSARPVVVNVSVVFDVMDPPRVVSSSFTDLLNGFDVVFDVDTDRGGLSGLFSCGAVLGLAAADSNRLLGSGSVCSWASSKMLRVTFGNLPLLVPGDAISLRDLAVKSSLSSASLFSTDESFEIGQPRVQIVAQPVLALSSTMVGRCDDLVMDSSASTGSGGRLLTYHYRVVAGNGENILNITQAFAEINAMNGGKGSHRVVVASRLMPLGSKFVVTLRVANFLGIGEESSTTVEKMHLPVPSMSIQGPSPRSAKHDTALQLEVTAALPDLGCLAGESLESSRMAFEWFEDTGGFGGNLVGTSKNPRALIVPAGALTALETYIFRVVGFMLDDPNVNSSASVTVVVSQQNLVARIAGGAVRQVGAQSSITLDGSSSQDPDESSVAMAYTWTCAAAKSNTTCLDVAVPFNSATISVPANSLSTGTYIFSLQVAKGSRQSETVSTSVEVVAGSPPVLSISNLPGTKYNAGGGFVSVLGTVSSTLGYTSIWSIDSSDVTSPFFVKSAPTPTVANKLSAVLDLSAFTVGNSYTIRLSATDSAGVSSFTTISLTMNEAPGSGAVAVTPSKGVALSTPFSFAALGWVDEDLPLSFRFGTVPVNDDLSLNLDSAAPFGDVRSSAFMDGVALPPSAHALNYTVGCFSEAVDSFGASGLAADVVRVMPYSVSLAKLSNASRTKAAEAIDSGNADAAKQVLSATLGSIASATDGSRRRQLLGTPGAGSADLRASVLESLWNTYAITPVTQADVASLLTVLASVVDTPGEVTLPVAESSMLFLKTVLEASQEAAVGISPVGAATAGTALSHLFETPLFNASDPASLARAADVATVLGYCGTLQLEGALDGVGYALAGPAVDMFSYRSSLSSLSELGVLSLSMGGSADHATALSVNSSAVELSDRLAAMGLAADGTFDVRLATLGANPFGAALKGSAGSAAAQGSRADQAAAAQGGATLLRSRLTVAEVALAGSPAPLPLTGLAAPVAVTLAATAPFNTSAAAYERAFACPRNGLLVELPCPLGAEEHRCDFGTHGGGRPYFAAYACPRVVPVCLWWDAGAQAFSDEGCAAAAGYAPGRVTCECGHLPRVLVLGAELRPGELRAGLTGAPSPAPSPGPSARPTHPPLPAPTTSPPTLAPTAADTITCFTTFTVVATTLPSEADKVPP